MEFLTHLLLRLRAAVVGVHAHAKWSRVQRETPGGRSSQLELGQASVEYALVLLGAAIVATVLIGWATNNNVLTGLFDYVVTIVKGKVK